MKNKVYMLLLGFGWVLLMVFLVSGSLFNKFSDTESSVFTPIHWKDHAKMFTGAIQCSLTDAELVQRKEELKDKIFSKLTRKEETEDGFVYFFDDDKVMLEHLFEFVEKEKSCCPFFKFDISILPFANGIALQISGSEEVKEFLEFEVGNFTEF